MRAAMSSRAPRLGRVETLRDAICARTGACVWTQQYPEGNSYCPVWYQVVDIPSSTAIPPYPTLHTRPSGYSSFGPYHRLQPQATEFATSTPPFLTRSAPRYTLIDVPLH